MRPIGQSIKFYWQLWATITEGLVDNQLKLRKAWWNFVPLRPSGSQVTNPNYFSLCDIL